jgi:hypothetical protein
MFKYMFFGVGLWCLFYAWRGTVPDVWNPGSKPKVGEPMPRSTRFIYGLGGALLTGLGLLLLRSNR